LRKSLSLKILFFFLIGFYCATAFATVIGQTGDWDILSAGLSVVVVEGIGALMYRASIPIFKNIKGFIAIFNYWKAGLSLGLFLDAFKYEIDSNFYCEKSNHKKYPEKTSSAIIQCFPLQSSNYKVQVHKKEPSYKNSKEWNSVLIINN
jgi:Protein of unknown function (DUF565)